MRCLNLLFILLLISTFSLCFGEGNIQPLWVREVDDAVNSVDISPDGKYIAVGCGYHRSGVRNGWVYLFDSNGNLLWKYKTKDSVECVKFGGDYIAVASWGGIYFFDKSGNLLWNYSAGAWTIDISKDGNYIVTGDWKLLFFDKNGNLLWEYKDIEDWFSALDMTPDGKYIVVGDKKGNIYYFDNNGHPLWKTKVDESILSISISDDGKYVAVGGEDKWAYFLDNKGNILWKKKIKMGIISLAIAPNTEYITVGYYAFDKKGNLLWKRKFYSNHDIITNDGKYIFSDCGDAVCKYDRNGNLLWFYNLEGVFGWYGLSATPDGRYVVVGDDENKVYFFDAMKYEKDEFLGTEPAILSIASKPDGEVYVNGTFYGKTPIDIKLKPGKYTIDVYKDGYLPFTKEIKVNSGEKYNIYAVLEKKIENEVVTNFDNIFIKPITLKLDINKDKLSLSESGNLIVRLINPKDNEIPLIAEVNIRVPSNTIVSGGDVLQSGGGVYSTTFKANPGDELTQHIDMAFSKPGKYLIKVNCIYYPKNHKNEYKELNYAKVIVVSEPKSNNSNNTIVVIGIIGLILAILAIMVVIKKTKFLSSE